MKKAVSVFLALVILMSLCTVSAYAQNLDITETSARSFSVTDESGISLDTVDGYVYGYIGDADNDDIISVMDATAIQLYCAGKQKMSAAVCKLADVDIDNTVTVIDATAIQFHVAEKGTSEYLNHVLYIPYDNFDPLTDSFDEIADYIVANGSFDKSESSYYLEATHTFEDLEIYVRISHAPVPDGLFDPSIMIYTITYYPEYDSYCKIVTSFTRGYKKINFYATEYTDDFTLYQLWDDFYVVDITDTLVLESDENSGYFTSDYDIAYSEIMEVVPNMCLLNLAYGEEFFIYDIPVTILDLIFDVQSLI